MISLGMGLILKTVIAPDKDGTDKFDAQTKLTEYTSQILPCGFFKSAIILKDFKIVSVIRYLGNCL